MWTIFVIVFVSVQLPACDTNSSAGDGGTDGDTITDTDIDTDADTDTDTGADTDADMDTDTDMETDTGPWSLCPDTDAYVGHPDWAHTLQPTEDAVYCGLFDEMRTLQEELYYKAQLRFVAGDYPLPETEGSFDFALPVCFLTPNWPETPQLAGAGPATSVVSFSDPWHYFDIDFDMPFENEDSTQQWTFTGAITYRSQTLPAAPAVLDGQWPGTIDGYDNWLSFWLCSGTDTCIGDLVFYSCGPVDGILNPHTVQFTGGEVVLDLSRGYSPAGTEPGVFFHAEGTLDDTAFVQDDYFKLIFNPEHHYESRDFAVLFDEPIGEACGLAVLGYTSADQPQIFTVDCELNPIEERELISATCDYIF